MDFFGCYIGMVEPPKDLPKQADLPSKKRRQKNGAWCVTSFVRGACAAMDPGGPKAVWERLAKPRLSKAWLAEDVEYVQEVIAQLREPTPEELQRLRSTKYPLSAWRN